MDGRWTMGGRMDGWSVGWYHLDFSAFTGGFRTTARTQIAWLVIFMTAPAHPHATQVAVYPSLFFLFPIFSRDDR